MPRPGITPEQVAEAAESLILEGKNPTVMAVRNQLGGGSPNTIAPLLAEWKTLNESRQAETLPAIPEQVETVMRQVWGAAWQEAQNQLEAEREALNKTSEDIKQERTEMLAEITRQDGELETNKEALRHQSTTLEAERQAHEQTRGQVREAQVLATEREGRITAQDAEMLELRQQLATVRAHAGRLEAELDHARGENERIQSEASARADDRQREIESLERQLQEQKRIIDTAGKKNMSLEAALEDERRERAGAVKVLADLRIESATLTERAAHAEEMRDLLKSLQAQLEKPKTRTRKRTTKSTAASKARKTDPSL